MCFSYRKTPFLFGYLCCIYVTNNFIFLQICDRGMLHWLFRRSNSKDLKQPGTEDTTSQCLSTQGTNTVGEHTDSLEYMSGTSDGKQPVERVTESAARTEDSDELQQQALDVEVAKDCALVKDHQGLRCMMISKTEPSTLTNSNSTPIVESEKSTMSENVPEKEVPRGLDISLGTSAQEHFTPGTLSEPGNKDDTLCYENTSQEADGDSLCFNSSNQELTVACGFHSDAEYSSKEKLGDYITSKTVGETDASVGTGDGETSKNKVSGEDGNSEPKKRENQKLQGCEESRAAESDTSSCDSRDKTDSAGQGGNRESEFNYEHSLSDVATHPDLVSEFQEVPAIGETDKKSTSPLPISFGNIVDTENKDSSSTNLESVKPKVRELFRGSFEAEGDNKDSSSVGNLESVKPKVRERMFNGNFEAEGDSVSLPVSYCDDTTRSDRNVTNEYKFLSIEKENCSCIERNSEHFHSEMKEERNTSIGRTSSNLCSKQSLASGFESLSTVHDIPMGAAVSHASNAKAEEVSKAEDPIGKAEKKPKPKKKAKKKNLKSVLEFPDVKSSSGLISRPKSPLEPEKLFTFSSCENPYPCCCHLSSLYSHPGNICTIFGKQYIFTKNDNVPMIVCLDVEDCENAEFRHCKLCWRGQTPMVLSSLEDGTKVMFDAVLMTGTNRYVALVVWHTLKPDAVTLLSDKSLLFLHETTGFRVQLVHLNENRMGFIKAIIDGCEETIFFSADIVFLNGKKAKTNDNIMLLFQFPSSDVYVKVDVYLRVGPPSGKVHIPTCIWNGVKPNDLLYRHPRCWRKLYRDSDDGVLPQELNYFSTLHCDTPCLLSLAESSAKIPSENKLLLKFILYNEISSVLFPPNKLFCKDRQVSLRSSFTSSCIEVKAHIVKQRLESSGEELYQVVMVQVPEEMVARTDDIQDQAMVISSDTRLFEDVPPESCRVGDPSSTAASVMSSTRDAIFSPNPAADFENKDSYSSHLRDIILPKPHETFRSVSNSVLSSNLTFKGEVESHTEILTDNKTASQIFTSSKDIAGAMDNNDSNPPKSDSLDYAAGDPLDYAENDPFLPYCNSSRTFHAKTSSDTVSNHDPMDALLKFYSEEELSKFQWFPNNRSVSGIHSPLHVDTTPSSYDDNLHSSSQTSSTYFSPVVGSPISDISSRTGSTHISNSKPCTNRTSVSADNLIKGNSIRDPKKPDTNAVVCKFSKAPQQPWSFGLPVPLNSKVKSLEALPSSSSNSPARSVTSETNKTDYLSTNQHASSDALSFSQALKQNLEKYGISASPINNDNKSQATHLNAISTTVENKTKKTLYRTTCKIHKIAQKSGVLIANGKVLKSSNMKAHFLGKFLYVDGKSLTAGDTKVFKLCIQPYVNKEWNCLLEVCQPYVTCSVTVSFITQLMWLGQIPAAPYNKLKTSYSITQVAIQAPKANAAKAPNSTQNSQVKVNVPAAPNAKQKIQVKDKAPTPPLCKVSDLN